MFILQPFVLPFIVIFKWIAELFLWMSNAFYKLYDLFLGWSITLNDKTESDVWIREE
jgi:hypothetical protein